MKVTYEFDTDNEDNLNDLKLIQQAKAMASALWDVDQELRSILRYTLTPELFAHEAGYEKVCRKLEALREDISNINLE